LKTTVEQNRPQGAALQHSEETTRTLLSTLIATSPRHETSSDAVDTDAISEINLGSDTEMLHVDHRAVFEGQDRRHCGVGKKKRWGGGCGVDGM
jgi:hypothetical protein